MSQKHSTVLELPETQVRKSRIKSYFSTPVDKRAMEYKNEQVVRRIMLKEGVTRLEAEILFNDMLQFLCLAASRKTAKLTPPRKIDAAWHHFILFTRDYSEFCTLFFGRFIHHQPFEIMAKGGGTDGCGDDGDCSASHHDKGDKLDEFTNHRPTSVETTRGMAELNFSPLSANWVF